jgi:hypothetical protein
MRTLARFCRSGEGWRKAMRTVLCKIVTTFVSVRASGIVGCLPRSWHISDELVSHVVRQSNGKKNGGLKLWVGARAFSSSLKRASSVTQIHAISRTFIVSDRPQCPSRSRTICNTTHQMGGIMLCDASIGRCGLPVPRHRYAPPTTRSNVECNRHLSGQDRGSQIT